MGASCTVAPLVTVFVERETRNMSYSVRTAQQYNVMRVNLNTDVLVTFSPLKLRVTKSAL